ncbi:MAG: hypothetical protein Q8M16_22130 [Pirellulaceae bacterium]|nr:hypothetical protein [Pirellulaceae bacterium]
MKDPTRSPYTAGLRKTGLGWKIGSGYSNLGGFIWAKLIFLLDGIGFLSPLVQETGKD